MRVSTTSSRLGLGSIPYGCRRRSSPGMPVSWNVSWSRIEEFSRSPACLIRWRSGMNSYGSRGFRPALAKWASVNGFGQDAEPSRIATRQAHPTHKVADTTWNGSTETPTGICLQGWYKNLDQSVTPGVRFGLASPLSKLHKWAVIGWGPYSHGTAQAAHDTSKGVLESWQQLFCSDRLQWNSSVMMHHLQNCTWKDVHPGGHWD